MSDKRRTPPVSTKKQKPRFVLSRKPKSSPKPKGTKKKAQPSPQLPEWQDEFCFADVHDRIMENYYDAQRRDDVAEGNYGRLQDGKVPDGWLV